MDYLGKIIIAFELHSVEEIKECFDNGINPDMVHNGKPLIYELINMYTRGPKFRQCVRAFVDYGLTLDDKALLSVLLDDHASLELILSDDKSVLKRTYSFNCAFTPLKEATLLHICAEYNHLATAEVLVKHGADINAHSRG